MYYYASLAGYYYQRYRARHDGTMTISRTVGHHLAWARSSGNVPPSSLSRAPIP